MSEEPRPGDAAAPASASAGALLRAAREAQGLHVAALAAALKVSPRKLEALEADRYGELPDATFARALAHTLARALKIDPKPVLDRLPAAAPLPIEPGDGGLNEPFREGTARGPAFGTPAPGASVSGAAGARRPLVWAAAALVLAAVLLYVVPLERWLGEPLPPAAVQPPAAAPAASDAAAVGDDGASAPAAVLPSASEPAAATTDPAVPGTAVAPSSVAASSPSVAIAPSTAPANVSPAPTPAAPTVTPAAAPAALTPVAPPPPPAGALVVGTSEESWVEIVDARGRTLVSRTLAPGERIGLDGAAPFAVVVGNAGATELVFRGRAIDLAARSRDNVARLELR